MNQQTANLLKQIASLKDEAMPTFKMAATLQARINELTKTLKETCDHSEVETIDVSTPPENRADATYCKTCDSWNVYQKQNF